VNIGKFKKSLTPYILLLPAFTILGYILIYPMINNIVLSLFDWRFTNPNKKTYVGLANYFRMFTSDPTFANSIMFTFKFTIFTILGELVVGLLVALLLNNDIKGRQFLAALYLLPYTLAPIAVGLCWRLIWAEDYGIINYLLSILGIDKVSWLAGNTTAIISVIIPEIWRSVPFVTLMIMAGLTSISNEMYEAAKVDGANVFQRFLRITLPLLVPTITIVLVFETVFKLRVFDLVFALTGGGPGSKTLPIGVYVYRSFFRYFEGGYASALSVFLLVVGGVISLIYIRLFYRDV